MDIIRTSFEGLIVPPTDTQEGPKCASVFLSALFFLWAHQHETFRDQSAMLGEHLSKNSTYVAHPYDPLFSQKRLPGGQISFFAIFVKRPNKPLGKRFQTQKTDWKISFFFPELQELEVRICVQPNFPIMGRSPQNGTVVSGGCQNKVTSFWWLFWAFWDD